jgi:hypothetical protein
MFSPRVARRTLQRYRKRGLDALERQMVAAVSAGGLQGARILEIGGGIGAIQTELLRAGADQGEVVELVRAYEPYARELARERGLEDRTSFLVQDVLETADGVEPAEVVVLNRVVCCSPEGVRLTGVAADLARQVLVLSFPRDRLGVKLALRLMNAGMRLMGRSFRVFVFPRASLVAAAEAEGLRLAEDGRGFAWEFVALRRGAQSPA